MAAAVGLRGIAIAATPCLPACLAPFPLHPTQADWLVPSSREDILASEAWNQMLRDQVRAWAVA